MTLISDLRAWQGEPNLPPFLAHRLTTILAEHDPQPAAAEPLRGGKVIYEGSLEDLTLAACGDPASPLPANLVMCRGCKQEVDPNVCGCGGLAKDHDTAIDGHPFVPIGCDCYRSPPV